MGLDERLLHSTVNGDFLKTLYDEYLKNRKNEKLISTVLSDLHNSGKVNLITEFEKLTRRDFNSEFFSLRHVLEDILPNLSAAVKDVMTCVKHLTIEAGDDMASHGLIGPFIKFCENNEERPDELLTIALNSDVNDFDFISPAIISGSKINLEKYTEKAIEIAFSKDEEKSKSGIFSLGKVDYKGNDFLSSKAFDAIVSSVSEIDRDHKIAIALKTLFSLASKCESLEGKFLVFVEMRCSSPGEQVIHSASEVLFFNKGNITEKIKFSLFNLAKKVDPKNTATINNIDYALEDLVKIGQAGKAIKIVEDIFETSSFNVSIGSFDSLERSLLDNDHRKILSNVITKWFLSGRVIYGKFCLDLLRNTNDKGLEISCDLSLIKGDLKSSHAFIARKACGWFFMRPISATSFMLSLVDTCPDDQLSEIEDIIFKPLLISYPGSVREYLEKESSDTSKRKSDLCQSLLKRLDNYHDGLKPAFDIKELKPSEDHRHTYQRYHYTTMQESMKEARKGSLTSLLGIQESVLLYGNKSIHYIHHGKEKTRQEIPLHTISHSIEFPSLQHIDPHGLDNQLRSFRLEGCTR